jgi:hypothetical protein
VINRGLLPGHHVIKKKDGRHGSFPRHHVIKENMAAAAHFRVIT